MHGKPSHIIIITITTKLIASLWDIKAPPRVLAVSWVAILGGIVTPNNLEQRRIIESMLPNVLRLM